MAVARCCDFQDRPTLQAAICNCSIRMPWPAMTVAFSFLWGVSRQSSRRLRSRELCPARFLLVSTRGRAPRARFPGGRPGFPGEGWKALSGYLGCWTGVGARICPGSGLGHGFPCYDLDPVGGGLERRFRVTCGTRCSFGPGIPQFRAGAMDAGSAPVVVGQLNSPPDTPEGCLLVWCAAGYRSANSRKAGP